MFNLTISPLYALHAIVKITLKSSVKVWNGK